MNQVYGRENLHPGLLLRCEAEGILNPKGLATPLRERFRQDPSADFAVALSDEIHAVLEEPGLSEHVVIRVMGGRPSLSF